MGDTGGTTLSLFDSLKQGIKTTPTKKNEKSINSLKISNLVTPPLSAATLTAAAACAAAAASQKSLKNDQICTNTFSTTKKQQHFVSPANISAMQKTENECATTTTPLTSSSSLSSSSSNTNINTSDDDDTTNTNITEDDRNKKKRCSDRYDSSESSDSGVATSLSCTDSSTASSDTSDPGSPYSDDAHHLSNTKLNISPQNKAVSNMSPAADVMIINPTIGAPPQRKSLSGGANNGTSKSKRSSTTNLSTTDMTAKKTRTITTIANSNANTTNMTASVSTTSGLIITTTNTANYNKRLKSAALEESQTKITGYFKSQMKPINPIVKNKDKQDPSAANLSKFFNILKTKNNEQQREAVINALTALTSVNNSNILLDTGNSNANASTVPTGTTITPVNNSSNCSLNNSSTLKKIERSKPTKIAQVAPNLRKPTTNGAGVVSTTTTTLTQSQGKQPQKKNVAIAPRTTDMLPKIQPQSQQQQLLQIQTQPQITQQQQPQPTVVLTTIRFPQQNGQNQQLQAQPQTLVGTTIPTTISYQLPPMGNLVTIPNIMASDTHQNTGPQYFLGNGGTLFKFQHMQQMQQMQQFSTTTTTTGGPTNSQNLIMKTTRQQQHVVQTSQISKQMPISNRPVLMATANPAGIILNAGSIPTMLAKPQQNFLPALQPINQTTNGTAQPQFSAQYITNAISSLPLALPPPPLALTTNPFTSKPSASIHTISASEPPPLVTISSNNNNSSQLSRNNKPPPQQSQQLALSSSLENELKIPPLVPRLQPQLRVIASAAPSLSKKNAPPANCKLLPKSSTLPVLVPPKPVKTPAKLPHIPRCLTIEKVDKSESSLVHLVRPCTPPSNVSIKLMPPAETETVPERVPERTSSELLTGLESAFSENLPTLTSASDVIFQDEASVSSSIQSSAQTSTNESMEIDIMEATKAPEAIDFLNMNSLTTPPTPPEIDTSTTDTTIKSAMSPILSQPKTIRFPALNHRGSRGRGHKRHGHDGVCYWEECNIKHDSNSKLIDHLQSHHVNTQSGPFACLWVGCKVQGRESCSRRWLERHVLSHGGSKQFKCIVDGCGLRFGSQLALQKHVNGHFNATENKDNANRRTSDPPVPKLLRKNGKKLKYRRQPFSARLFDFFDAGIMEGLDHRMVMMSKVTNLSTGSITFNGTASLFRTTFKGVEECLVKWSPPDIIADEWMPVPKNEMQTFTKTIKLKSMQHSEKLAVDLLLQSSYKKTVEPPKSLSCLDLLNDIEKQQILTYKTQTNDNKPVIVLKGSRKRKQLNHTPQQSTSLS